MQSLKEWGKVHRSVKHMIVFIERMNLETLCTIIFDARFVYVHFPATHF